MRGRRLRHQPVRARTRAVPAIAGVTSGPICSRYCRVDVSVLTIVCVRHAILGAGGVGGLVGGALARAGRDVVLLLRVEKLARHPARLRVESVALGEFEVDVATASLLDRDVDVLWVTPKAAQ